MNDNIQGKRFEHKFSNKNIMSLLLDFKIIFVAKIRQTLSLFPTIIAISDMNTNSFSTSGTSPSCFFIFNKFSYSEFPNIFKIFNRAHIVFCPISFIHLFNSFTRKFITFKTKS